MTLILRHKAQKCVRRYVCVRVCARVLREATNECPGRQMANLGDVMRTGGGSSELFCCF